MLVAGAVLPAGVAAEPASQPSSAAAAGIDVGRYHSCALVAGIGLRCWGYGGDGALGYSNRSTIGDDELPKAAGPVDLGPGRSAVAVSAGFVHTCAVQDDARVRCWGFGADGRLGYADTESIGDDEAPGSVAPVDLGSGRTAMAVTAGGAHSCAVLDNGAVRCWGNSISGQLGYGSLQNIGNDETPGSIGPVKLGAGRSAKAITAGTSHTCALLDDGAVRCWGLGSNGQLGYGTTDNIGDDETPDTVGPVGLGPARAVAVTAGSFHSCALSEDGTVRCWGFGGNGRLGYGNTASIGDDERPDSVRPVDFGPARRAVAITAGADHTCAVLDDRTVRCWGFGGNGRLGYANRKNVGDDETPGSAGPVDLGPGRTAVAIAAGGNNTCARLDDGEVRCWGESGYGRLGTCSTEAIGDDETPGSVAPVDLGGPGTIVPACAQAPEPVAGGPVAGGTVSPVPGPSPPDARPSPPATSPSGSPRRSAASVAALAAQSRRATALRACLRGAARPASSDLRRARLRRASARAVETRALARIAVKRRRVCLARYARTPGRVSALAARATAGGTVTLTFRAAGTAASRAPASRSYVVKQARRPIRGARDFARAGALCKGVCSFDVEEVGERITLTITDLRPGRAYYYAVSARDNVSARLGPRSKTVAARPR